MSHIVQRARHAAPMQKQDALEEKAISAKKLLKKAASPPPEKPELLPPMLVTDEHVVEEMFRGGSYAPVLWVKALVMRAYKYENRQTVALAAIVTKVR